MHFASVTGKAASCYRLGLVVFLSKQEGGKNGKLQPMDDSTAPNPHFIASIKQEFLGLMDLL